MARRAVVPVAAVVLGLAAAVAVGALVAAVDLVPVRGALGRGVRVDGGVVALDLAALRVELLVGVMKRFT